MNESEQLYILCKEHGISDQVIAERLKVSPQAVGQKYKHTKNPLR